LPESDDRRPGAVLYVVATPIGNLEDITHRAVKVLKAVDLVAAEDTRRTRALLRHLGISKPLVSYYDAVESRRVPVLIARLEKGERIALVSDAGTPAISDPGHRLIRAAVDAEIAVVPVPGVSALTTSLMVAGLPCERFVFEGFLPSRASQRSRRLEDLRRETRTLVFFEAPYRVAKTLTALFEAFGDRSAVMARELTKRFEEIRRGTLGELAELASESRARGEITLVVAGAAGKRELLESSEPLDAAIQRSLETADPESCSLRDVVDLLASERPESRRQIYRRTLEIARKT